MGMDVQKFMFDGHEVMAVKPLSAHPGDKHLFVVIHRGSSSYIPFVVHTYNRQDGGFYNGSYCEDMTQALGVFNRR